MRLGYLKSAAPMSGAAAFFIFLASAAAAALGTTGFPMVLELERGIPRRGGPSMDSLKARDMARHGRLLKSSGVADFPVQGSGDPFTVGLYYTRVMLGTPPKEFYVQIDTGSDTLWVSCASCSSCPTSSALSIQLNFFDPSESSTSSLVSCADEGCISAVESGEAQCSSYMDPSTRCAYTFQYGDGSSTSGNYVSDKIYFGTTSGDGQTGNSSATVLFGCSTFQSGELTQSDRAIDGIFGFGKQDISVISQLSSKGASPKVFSHCLDGNAKGGGILVLGEIAEPGIVYTPMVQSQPHYNLNLTSIEVDGKTVPIHRSALLTTDSQGTIVDSGTTLAYLADKAYDPFVDAITSSISSSVNTLDVKGNQCYVTASSVDQVFPSVTLNFEGGTAMTLNPDHYLLQQGSVGNAAIMCIGWQKNTGQEMTILGDLVLKDKIFVYDLANQRIGWKDYDCSLSVKVGNTTTGSSSSSSNNNGNDDDNNNNGGSGFFGGFGFNAATHRADAGVLPALLAAIFSFLLTRLDSLS